MGTQPGTCLIHCFSPYLRVWQLVVQALEGGFKEPARLNGWWLEWGGREVWIRRS